MLVAPAHLVLSLSIFAPTQGDAVLPDSFEEGAVAPANRWYAAGGCAARTGFSVTRAMLGSPEVAWSYTPAKGAIESEPLVWDEFVALATKVSDKERQLHVLSLLTGKQIARPQVFHTPLPLEPSLAKNIILVRSSPTLLQAYRIDTSGLTAIWNRNAAGKEPYGAPLLFGSEIYVTEGRQLERLTFNGAYTRWRVEGDFIGSPSLKGKHLYLPIDGGQAFLKIPRSGGKSEMQRLVPTNFPRMREQGEFALALLDSGVFCYPGRSAFAPDASRFVAVLPPNQPPVAVPLLAPAAECVGGWLGYTLLSASGNGLVRAKRDDFTKVNVLASSVRHAQLLRPLVAPSCTGNVAYAGGCAFDLETGEIYWRFPLDLTFRPVPARETLLLVERDTKLVALREARGSGEQAIGSVVASTKEAASMPLGVSRAVLRDGSVKMGEWLLDFDRQMIAKPTGATKSKPAESYALADLFFLEDPAGKLLFAQNEEDVLQGMESLVDSALAEGYYALAKESLGTSDADLLERLLQEAAERGAQGDMSQMQDELSRWRKTPPHTNSQRVQMIADHEKALLSRPADIIFQRVSAIPAVDRSPLLLSLLRAVLSHDAGHSGAAARVRSLLPDGLEVPEPYNPLEWLDFLEAAQQCPVSIVTESKDASRSPTADERKLMWARDRWRHDLVAFRSEHLMIYTPLAQKPGALARCLSMGELVCQATSQVFAENASNKGERPRELLQLFLYDSKEEYISHTQQSDIHATGPLEWTAGHYDVLQDITRIYVPKQADAFERVLGTYAHELTHHWMQKQCPLFTLSDTWKMHAEEPGLWIVEGLAQMVSEFRFDLKRRRWSALNPRAGSLDYVANAEAKQLLDWRKVFELRYSMQRKLDTQPIQQVPMSWRLFSVRQSSQMNAFYNQSAAACHYLFEADGGKLRQKWFESIAKVYQGAMVKPEIPETYGMSMEELGAATVAYAKQVIDGGN